MRFENTGLEKMKADLNRLDEVMSEHGLIRAEQWDYERVNYDRKFELKEGVFYLRVQGYAVEGDVGAHRAVIQLMIPLLGKHYYPHGVEYGEGENFPASLVKKCEQILADVKADIEKFATV
ncbi:YugN family protein [Peribacillus tepidiphilus]|uniref:YugN family protein n=1 Tax=Peribacillus tepidiphilus TaxID=2652445 RepID=UPI001292B338|nr:YugN family protein [Peribacillus tepidiphilus]